MSKFAIDDGITHIPSIKRWQVSRDVVSGKIATLGLEPLYPGVHADYRYTDEEGGANLLPHLVLKSSLYKPTFTCINYAFRVWDLCGSLYGLNTWVPVIGKIPAAPDVRHAWILILLGDILGIDLDRSLYFEPNSGFEMGTELEMAYQAFPIGEAGYKGEMAFY